LEWVVPGLVYLVAVAMAIVGVSFVVFGVVLSVLDGLEGSSPVAVLRGWARRR
jgi:hypothetical protein